jgi:hypothetical protein
MWDGLEMVRIEGDFLSLAGTGEIWDRVENVAWQKCEIDREKGRVKQADRRSRLLERLAHAAWERQARQRNRTIDNSLRCCGVCRRMYIVTKQQVVDGTRFCSLRCSARYRYRKRGAIRVARTATIEGRTLTVVEWAKRLKIHFTTVCKRIRQGMTPEEALTCRAQPREKPRRMETIHGETRSFDEWAKHYGVSGTMVRRRMSEGMSFEDALRAPRKRQYLGRRKCRKDPS